MTNKKTIPLLIILTLGLGTWNLRLYCLATETEASNKIDSLNKVIQSTSSDSIKINTLNELSWSLKSSNPDTAISLSTHALKLAREIDSKKGVAKSQNNLGVYHYYQSDFTNALKYYYNSLNTYKEINDKKGIGSSYNNIGNIYFRQSNYPKALEYYFKSLEIKKEMNYKKGMTYTYNNIGVIYKKQENYKKALKYYLKSLDIDKEMNNKSELANSFTNIANIKKKQGDFIKALEYHFKALEVRKDINDKRGMTSNYTNLGYLLSSTCEKEDSTKKTIVEWFKNKGELEKKRQHSNFLRYMKK